MTNTSPRYHDTPTASALATEAAISLGIDVLEAAVAAGVLMAHADGEMAAAERRKLLGLIREHRSLQVFPREQVADEVAMHEANFRLDPEVAQILAREKLASIVGRPKMARQVVALCRELIAADGVRHPSEYRVLAEIRSLLGLDREDAVGGTPAAGGRL